MSKKETVKKEKAETPKKKKRHIGLKILISFLIIFLVLPLTFILGFLVTWKPGADLSNVKEINELSEVINDELYESLNHTTDDPNPRVELKLGEGELNSLLGLVRKKYLPAAVQQYIPQIYCRVDGEEYTFGIDAKYSIIQTSVKVKTEILLKGDEIVFKLKSIQLGRVPLLDFIQDALLKLGTKYFSDEQLNNFFKNIGGESGISINVDFDLEHGKISYSRENFIKDLVKIVEVMSGKKENNEDTSIDLMSILIQLVQKDELFDPVTSGGLGAQIYLNSNASNSSLIYYPNETEKARDRTDYLNLSEVRNYAIDVFNKNTDNPDLDPSTAIPDLFNFFVYGYDSANPDASYIETCKKINITTWPDCVPDKDYKKYPGAPYRDSAKKERDTVTGQIKANLFEKISDTNLIKLFDNPEDIGILIKPDGQVTKPFDDILEISDKELRALCSQLDIVGYSKPIFKKEKNYQANYIGLKDLDFRFVDGGDTNDTMNAYAILDINGQTAPITLNTILQPQSSSAGIDFKLKETYLGQIPTSTEMPSLNDALIDLISYKTQDSDLFSLNKIGDDNYLSVNFASMLPEGYSSIFNDGINLTFDPQQEGIDPIKLNIKAVLEPKIVPAVTEPEKNDEMLVFDAKVTATHIS